MRYMIFAAVLVGLTAPAVGQTAKPPVVNGKPLTVECVANASKKNIEIQVTNPNGVDKTCSLLKCIYTAADKKSHDLTCRNVGVFKDAKKLPVCADGHPKGPAPYTNTKVEWTCT